MASSNSQQSVGWIVSDPKDYSDIMDLLGPNRVQSTQLGDADDFNFTVGEMHNKAVCLVNAPVGTYQYASASMKKRFSITILFIGGTYPRADAVSYPPIGHCLLQMPEIDEQWYEQLRGSIPADDISSWASLTTALDRFREGSKIQHYNLNQTINQWAKDIPGVLNGLMRPDPDVICKLTCPMPYLREWC